MNKSYSVVTYYINYFCYTLYTMNIFVCSPDEKNIWLKNILVFSSAVFQARRVRRQRQVDGRSRNKKKLEPSLKHRRDYYYIYSTNLPVDMLRTPCHAAEDDFKHILSNSPKRLLWRLTAHGGRHKIVKLKCINNQYNIVFKNDY